MKTPPKITSFTMNKTENNPASRFLSFPLLIAECEYGDELSFFLDNFEGAIY